MSDDLNQKLAELNLKVAAEKAETGDVSTETAMAWWLTATTIRDLQEARPADCAH